jgi:hypothetical protein
MPGKRRHAMHIRNMEVAAAVVLALPVGAATTAPFRSGLEDGSSERDLHLYALGRGSGGKRA